MILFCGIPTEPPLALAIAAAAAAEARHVVFNQRETFGTDMLLECRHGEWSGTLWTQGTAWPLEGFTGVYTRMIDHGSLPESRLPVRALERSRLLLGILAEWIEMTGCRVLNKAGAMASNGSKPYQSQWIRRTGFLTPPTLVTNDPGLALDFARQHERVIYKSTSAVRSIVREFDPSQHAALPRIRSLPTQFQARIIGTNIRVHIVGEQVFATEIVSTAVDYRYAHRDGLEVEMHPVVLPTDIAARCVQLSKTLQLPFCGIDLMRTSRGEYYCFEVNPSPAYSYFEHEAGQPILARCRGLSGRQRRLTMPDVHVVENWADVTGRLVAIRPDSTLEDHVSVTLDQSTIRSVPGFPNLFEADQGQAIHVNVPVAAARRLEALLGTTVSWRIRKAGPSSNFAHPASLS